jgi:hypothetical protein
VDIFANKVSFQGKEQVSIFASISTGILENKTDHHDRVQGGFRRG